MHHSVKDTPGACWTNEVLFRLRWNIFHDFDAIEVEEGLDGNGIEIRSPLLSHELANEVLFDQPFHKMRLFSQDLESIAGTTIEITLQTPAPNAQVTTDTPITILRFVKEVHKFISQHEDAIRSWRKSFIRTTTQDGSFADAEEIDHKPTYFFKQVFINQHDDVLFVTIHVFGEGEFGSSLEKFLDIQRRSAASLHEKRLEVLEAQNTQPSNRIRLDVLSRLRWSVTGTVEDIQICAQGPDIDATPHEMFLDSPVPTMSLFDPPVTSLEVMSSDVLEARAYQMESEQYPYEPLIIKNAEGTPVTIAAFVQQVHAHLKDYEAFIVNYRRTMGFNAFYHAVKANTNGKRVKTETVTESRLCVKYIVSRTAFGNVQVRMGCALNGESDHAMADLHKAGVSLTRNDVECATLEHGF